MALARITTWSSGQVLKAADLNGEFNNILNNALSLISPLTGTLNANSNQVTNLVLEKLATAPAAATQGRVWVNTAANDPGIDSGASPTLSIRDLIPQCRLAYVTSSQIAAQPYNGNRVPIKTGNAWETWPIATTSGIAISSTMAANSTSLYYAYLYNNGGTLTGLLSTAAHSASTETGVEVMTTDATRTLAGMAFSSTTALYYSTLSTATLVASWANRVVEGIIGGVISGTITSTTPTEVSSAGRVRFLTWSNEAVYASASGNCAPGGGQAYTALSFDSASSGENPGLVLTNLGGQPQIGFSITVNKHGLAEGYHELFLNTWNSTNGANNVFATGTAANAPGTAATVQIRV